MKETIKVKNIFGEDLDVLLEGNLSAKNLMIFVHGFGTDKDEGFAYFVDLSEAFQKEYLLIRYDASGFGKSEGAEAEFQFQKSAGDLDSILRYARREYPQKSINIIAHSLGNFSTVLLSPEHIRKTVFTGAINLNLKLVSNKLKERIVNKGGTIDEEGMSTYPRASGAIQKIGKDFWRTLNNVDMKILLGEFSQKTELIVFKSKQDEVVGSDESFNEYKKITSLKYVEIEGDHNFSKREDRSNLIEEIKVF